VSDLEVTLFTHAGCPDSPWVREWLERHGIRFTERSLDDDPGAVEELSQTGLFVTPLLLVGDQRVVGFRRDRLEEIFNK
jgi:glutaredoxin 3